jgi:hypothetical protein
VVPLRYAKVGPGARRQRHAPFARNIQRGAACRGRDPRLLAQVLETPDVGIGRVAGIVLGSVTISCLPPSLPGLGVRPRLSTALVACSCAHHGRLFLYVNQISLNLLAYSWLMSLSKMMASFGILLGERGPE